MKIARTAVLAAALFLLAGNAWGVVIDGDFTDWTAVPKAWVDPVNSPLTDSTNDFEYRGLGSAGFPILAGSPLVTLLDSPPLPDGPFAEAAPGPEDELDVEYVQHALEGGTLYIRAKMAPGVTIDVADYSEEAPSALSATEPHDPVYEQSIYDILIDVDPGSGLGFTNDFTFTGSGPRHFSALDGADFLLEVTDPRIPEYSVYQLYRYVGNGSSFVWEWVAEVQGAMDGNSLEVAVPLALLGYVPSCNSAIGYALVTSDSEDWWGDDLAPGYLGEVGASYWYVGQPADWWTAQLAPGLTKEAVVTPMRYIQLVFDGPEYCPPEETNACPKTQGYWWRQVTSLGLITGYKGGEKAIHPDWTKAELLALFRAVDPQLAFSGQSTAQALWANPANSMKEKSLKQFAALLLNTNSGRLSAHVPVDLRAWRLGELEVGAVLGMLQAKWLAGKYYFVNDVADSINTGASIKVSAGCYEPPPKDCGTHQRTCSELKTHTGCGSK